MSTPATQLHHDRLPIAVRPAEPGDLPLVYGTWLRALRYSSRSTRGIDSKVFFALHHLVIERLLARGARILVACAVDAPEVIYGYLCFERLPSGSVAGIELPLDVLHFAYTKGAFRRFGVQRELFRESAIDPNHFAYTHLTSDGEQIAPMFPGSTYVPYLQS